MAAQVRVFNIAGWISPPSIKIAQDFDTLTNAGYTGTISDMRRKNLLNILGFSEPRGTNNDLELLYYRSAGYTDSIMTVRHQP